MVFVAYASAAQVCSPDQASACNFQAQTFAKYAATSSESKSNSTFLLYAKLLEPESAIER